MTPLLPSEGSVVPKNYDELYAQYGGFIYKLLYKANKIERNMEDLHAYIWVKLLEANILERFEEFVQLQAPKVLTALEACDFFGVSWAQWCSAMCAYHKGYLVTSGKKTQRRQGRWMPTPINLAEFEAEGQVGYTSKTALYSYEDLVQLSVDERVLANGEVRGPFRVMGRKIDADGNVIGDSREEGLLKVPGVPVTVAQFKNYLTMAVRNHYANFCRTAERRHKERPYTPPAHMRDEDSPSWESMLPDLQHADSDTMLSLAEARKILSDTLHECADGVELCKPVAEHEVEVFAMLENGASLMQALRDSELPPRVRTAVIDSMRETAQEF